MFHRLERSSEDIFTFRLPPSIASHKAAIEALDKVRLLIIDELSYIKMDKERESLFFQVIRRRYEKSSLIVTTNLPVGRWDELFTDALAATAILDRILHHCHVISISGDSYRIKNKK